MIRFALVLLMSLAVSSQAGAAVKWNNSGKIEAEAPFWKGENQFKFVVPSDVIEQFQKTPVSLRQTICYKSKAEEFKLEAIQNSSVPTKISGYNSRMDNGHVVEGVKEAEQFVRSLSEVVTSAWALEDNQKKEIALNTLHYWSSKKALTQTKSCINEKGLMKSDCTYWKRDDGQDLAYTKDWDTTQMILSHIAYAYYFGIANFQTGNEKHKLIQKWLNSSFQNNKQANEVYFGLDLGWYWPKILEVTLKKEDPTKLIQKAVDGLNNLVLEDGSLKDRTTRGNRALWYHHTGLIEAYITLEMARLYEVQIPKGLEQRLQTSVSLFLKGFEDHSFMDKWAETAHNAIHTPGKQIFHETLAFPGGNSWIYIFAYRNPNHPLTSQLMAYLEKDENSPRRDVYLGFGFGCIYGTLYANYLNKKHLPDLTPPITTQFIKAGNEFHIYKNPKLQLTEQRNPEVKNTASNNELGMLQAYLDMEIIDAHPSLIKTLFPESLNRFYSLIALNEFEGGFEKTTSLGIATGHFPDADLLSKINKLSVEKCGTLPKKLHKKNAFEWIFVVTKTRDVRIKKQQDCILDVFNSHGDIPKKFYQSFLMAAPLFENYAREILN